MRFIINDGSVKIFVCFRHQTYNLFITTRLSIILSQYESKTLKFQHLKKRKRKKNADSYRFTSKCKKMKPCLYKYVLNIKKGSKNYSFNSRIHLIILRHSLIEDETLLDNLKFLHTNQSGNKKEERKIKFGKPISMNIFSKPTTFLLH